MWIRVDVGMPTHRKTRRLIKRLSSGQKEVVGALVLLLMETRIQAPDGFLHGYTDEDIAHAADWDGDAHAFTEALVEAGFLDRSPDERGFRMHDWKEHNGGHLHEAAKKARQRLAKQGGVEAVGSRSRSRSRSPGSTPGEPDDDPGGPGAGPGPTPGWPRVAPGESRGRPGDGPRPIGAVLEGLLGPGGPIRGPRAVPAPPGPQAGLQGTQGTLLAGPAPAPKRPRAPVAEALLACPGLDRAGQRTVAQLINRLHARGIVTTGVLVKIARLYVEDRSRIKNVFAYFSPGSEGFDFIRTRMSAELQVEEHEAIKLADPTWLTRKKGAA